MADEGNGIDIASLMSGFQTMQSDISSMLPALDESFSRAENAILDSTNAMREAGAAQMDINVINAKQEQEVRSRNSAAAASFGTNPTASSYVLDAMAKSVLESEKQLDVRDKAIQKKLDTGLLDDPFSWIINQITLPTDIEGYNSQVIAANRKLDTISKLQDRTKEQFAINASIDQVDAEKKTALLNTIAQNNIAIEAAKSEAKLAELGITKFNVRQKLSENTFNNIVQLNTALNAKMALELQVTANERAKVNNELAAEQRDLLIEQRRGSLEAEKLLQTKLNNVTDILGMSRIGFKEFQLMSGAMKASLEQMMVDPDIQQGRLGPNAAQALDNVNNLNAPLTPGVNLIRSKLLDIKNATAGSDQLWSQKKPAEQQLVVQKNIEAAAKKEAANIPVSGGMYSPAPLQKVLQIPVVQETMIYKDLAPLGAASAEYPTKADDIWKIAISNIAEGKATPAQMAQDISRIYRAINVDNSDIRQYRRFALPSQTTHKTTVYLGTGWNTSKVIDMTSVSQLEAELTRNFLAIKANEDAAAAARKNFPAMVPAGPQ